jgi:PAS domain S-box-containing protein
MLSRLDNVRFIWDSFAVGMLSHETTSNPYARELRNGFDCLFRQASDAFLLVDTASYFVVDVNAGAEQRLDRPRHELIARSLVDVVPGLSGEDLGAEGAIAGVEWTHVFCRGGDHLLVRLRGEDAEAAERRFRESEARHRLIVQTAAEGIMTLDASGHITYANERVMTLLGWPLSEMLGRPLQEFVVETTRAYPRAGAGGRDWGATDEVDLKLRCQDGSERWVMMTGRPILDEDGNYAGALRMFTDITQRKESERQLRQSEGFFRSLVESTLDMILAVDNDSRVTEFNRAAETALGYGRNEVVGHPVSILFADPKAPASLRQESMAFGGAIRELLMRRKDGELVPCRVSASVLRGGDGEPMGWMAVARDIGELRRTMEQLRLLGAAVRDTAEAVMITDARLPALGHPVLFANDAFGRLTGYDPEIINGQDAKLLYGPSTEASFIEAVDHAMRNGETFVGEATNRRKDGADLALQWRVSPLRDESGRPAYSVTFLRDVTSEKRAESERLRASRLESIGVLAAGIGHDFNNLFTAIGANVDLVFKELPEEAPTRRLLDDAKAAIQQASNLSRQLLTFSRGGEPVKKITDVGDLVRRASQFVLHGSKSRAEVQLAEDLWMAEVDSGQLEQVVHNLVINASQAMPNGGTIRITAENVQITSDLPDNLAPGPFLKLTLKDEGCGIPEHLLAKIFDPYFTTKQTGTGLGLASVFSIVRRHAGWITVRSKMGEGATFEILLPAAPGAARPRQAVQRGPHKGSGRVLVMDDDPLVRRAVRTMLRTLGYEVHETASGAEALEKMREEMAAGRQYTFCTLDLTVPGGLGGADVVRDLVALDPSLRAIACSGYSEDPIMSRFGEYGFAAALTKPFDADTLGRALDELNAGSRAP